VTAFVPFFLTVNFQVRSYCKDWLWLFSDYGWLIQTELGKSYLLYIYITVAWLYVWHSW